MGSASFSMQGSSRPATSQEPTLALGLGAGLGWEHSPFEAMSLGSKLCQIKKKNWIQDNALPLKRGVQGCCPTMRTVSTFNAVFSVLHPVCSFCQVGDLVASLQNMLLTVSL